MRQVLCSFLTVLLCVTVVHAADEHGATADFALALPGYHFSFPRDHGSHNEFQTEWWYYTGQVRSRTGNAYGYQLTFFRHGLESQDREPNPSRWAIRHLYLAHFAVTELNNTRFTYSEKMSRAGIGKAGADSDALSVWIDDWTVTTNGWTQHLRANLRSTESTQTRISIDFDLIPAKTTVVHGHDGVSRKGSARGQASHYYSMPRLRTEGRLTIDDEVHLVHGMSWMDHEFGTNQLGADQIGWDWFGLQLEDGSELMLYRLRLQDGTKDPASSGSLIAPDATHIHLTSKDFFLQPLRTWISEKSGASYPISWKMTIPAHGLTLDVVPYMEEQELITDHSTQVTYWEGAVRVHGHRNEQPIHGQGYMELTGYAGSHDVRF